MSMITRAMAIILTIELLPMCIGIVFAFKLPSPSEVFEKVKDVGNEVLDKANEVLDKVKDKVEEIVHITMNQIGSVLQRSFDQLQSRIDQSANNAINALQKLIVLSISDSQNLEKML